MAAVVEQALTAWFEGKEAAMREIKSHDKWQMGEGEKDRASHIEKPCR